MIRRLEAQRFRNLEPLGVELEAGTTLLVGPTGAGKTSLLEAIYVATTTRSFRTGKLEDCVQGSAPGRESGSDIPGFWTRVEVEGARRSRLEVAWSSTAGLERTVDGERAPISDHLERQSVLAFSWEDAATWVGEPERRRRFVDRGLVAERTATLDRLSRYRRVLAHKRSLLAAPRVRATDLEPWNQLFAEAAAAVQRLRGDYVARLEAALADSIRIAGLELSGVTLSYRPSPALDTGDEQGLLARLAGLTTREIEARRPLAGPHRDTIELELRAQPIGRVASSGERKALSLLCLAAQASLLETAGRSAALLIDDADVELDRPTLHRVWRTFRQAPQVLLSSNRSEVWVELVEGRRLGLSEGRVVET